VLLTEASPPAGAWAMATVCWSPQVVKNTMPFSLTSETRKLRISV
jgi:hypothetical protein